MKEYFKFVLKSLVKFSTSLFWSLIVIGYVVLCSAIIDKSIWFAIPLFILSVLLTCLVYSKLEDKSMDNYMANVLFVFLITFVVSSILLFVIGVLALIILLLKFSFWFAIPIFIIGFLLYSYIKYKGEDK